jgi:hypothetical protein
MTQSVTVSQSRASHCSASSPGHSTERLDGPGFSHAHRQVCQQRGRLEQNAPFFAGRGEPGPLNMMDEPLRPGGELITWVVRGSPAQGRSLNEHRVRRLSDHGCRHQQTGMVA